jgi:DNA-binding NarL/FixJ family response regulator
MPEQKPALNNGNSAATVRAEPSPGGAEDPFAALSPREYQVFTLLVEGTRVKEIGARLGLSPKTIDTYRVNLMRKLDIHDVAGLVKFAIQRDLISSR